MNLDQPDTSSIYDFLLRKKQLEDEQAKAINADVADRQQSNDLFGALNEALGAGARAKGNVKFDQSYYDNQDKRIQSQGDQQRKDIKQQLEDALTARTLQNKETSEKASEGRAQSEEVRKQTRFEAEKPALESDKARTTRENDPLSEDSKLAQQLAGQMFPGRDVSGMSATQLKTLLPTMKDVYEIEQKKLDKAADRQLRGEELDLKKDQVASKQEQTDKKLSAGERQVDKKFADEYTDYIASGGAAGAEKQLGQLKLAIENLKTRKDISGPLLSKEPDIVKAIINPASLTTQQDIEDVIQRSMRPILGAQFTEREGTQLLRRAFDPKLSEEENAKKVTRIYKHLVDAARAKEDAVKYYEANGTLKGFKGKLFDVGGFSVEQAPATESSASAPSTGFEHLSDSEIQDRISKLRGK